MKKSNVRSYVIAAFRYYARMGEPDKIAIKKLKHLTEAERRDLSAVAAMLLELSHSGDVTTIAVVREVYFFEPEKHLKKNDVTNRVVRYALENYTSDRNVWRSIDKAMRLFIELRCLRVDKEI